LRIADGGSRLEDQYSAFRNRNMIGRTIGNYEVISRFGEGGMGELYLGRHTRLAREVIIKTIRTEEFSSRQIEHLRVRLEREAYIQSQLDNSHIVRVYDFIAAEDTTCMVMEYVPGRDLRKMIQQETGPVAAPRAIKLFRQVLQAIDYAHTFTYADPSGEKHIGIIHRDLKPANILVTPDDVVKVTDFGIVKVRGVKGGTQLGFNPGTPEYMSPEQARGRELDQRSDIYSLGVVFYEMLTGRVPFEDDGNATSDYEVRRGHIEMPVPRPSEVYPGVPVELEKIVLKSLEKDPDHRFQTAREFLMAIDEYERTGSAAGALRSSTAGGRQTVVQPHRTQHPANPAAVGTVTPASATVPQGANVATVGNRPIRIGAESDNGYNSTTAIQTGGPAKSKLPIIVGVALLVVIAAGIGIYKMRATDSSTSTLPTRTNTGGTTSSGAPAGMISIPGGEFVIGRDNGSDYEGPAHKVTVKPFSIDKTEVTNAQYAEFIAVTGHQAPSHWVDGKYPAGEANFPVVNVNWYDARDYAQWAGKRLPTEEEWEYAARGRENYLYPYGNTWKPQFSNAAEDGYGKPRAAGSYPDGASPFGVLDMAGNVAEWTATEYKPYPGSKAKPDDGYKVIRGGAFNTKATDQTATDRRYISPSTTRPYVGFRCAKDAS
jgi:serine/threonine-protein kinase